MAQHAEGITLQLLAEDYDVDINHELDSIRNHRSRVNLLTTIRAVGVDRTVRLAASGKPEVFLPFDDSTATVQQENGSYTITLPEACSYAIIHITTKED